MDYTSPRLTVTPVNLLPIERKGSPSDEEIMQQKKYISEKIVDQSNDALENDYEAMEFVCTHFSYLCSSSVTESCHQLGQLGSDTMINAFVCNFRASPNDPINNDIVQSNFLNQRLYDRLSVRTLRDVINDRPLIINRTEFKQSAYKNTLTSLKKRMKVEQGPEDMVALSNVSMFVSFTMLLGVFLICVTIIGAHFRLLEIYYMR